MKVLSFFSRGMKGLLLVLFLGALVFAITDIPQEGGHSSNEIKPLVQEKSATCVGPSCSVQCDPGYIVFSGACTTTATGEWNLFGARDDHKYWDCVDGTGGLLTSITAEVTCVKAEFDSSVTPFCGDYVVEPPEYCDGPNLGGYDCTDFQTTQGAQLCNGVLGACSSTCNSFDVSNCQYCNPGTCPSPTILCFDGTCKLDCGSSGGPDGPSGESVGPSCSSGGCFFPPGQPIVPPSIGAPPIPFCGDGIIDAGEECDPPGAAAPSCPGPCAPPACMDDCTCPVIPGWCDPGGGVGSGGSGGAIGN